MIRQADRHCSFCDIQKQRQHPHHFAAGFENIGCARVAITNLAHIHL